MLRATYICDPTILRNLFGLHPVRLPPVRSMSYRPLQILLNANKEWAQSVTKDTPDFFTRSAIGQKPKVCPSMRSVFNHVFKVHFRSFGLAALTREYQNQSSQHLSLAISLYTETLPSMYEQKNLSDIRDILIICTCSQFHLHDDSALSVLTFAIKEVGVEHGEFLTTLLMRSILL